MINNDLLLVQPIDGYVRQILMQANERFNLGINTDMPTRGERLKAAMALKEDSNGFTSMEIMVGRRVSSTETAAESFTFLRLAQAMSGDNDLEHFFEGFAHLYWPELK